MPGGERTHGSPSSSGFAAVLPAKQTSAPDQAVDSGFLERGWCLVVVAAGRLGPGLCGAGDAGQFVQRAVHVGGCVACGVRADKPHPGVVVGKRHYRPDAAAQVLGAQARQRVRSGEPVVQRGAAALGECLLELVVRLAAGTP